MTEVFLRRLTPSLIPFVGRQHDFRILSIHRPVDELKALLTKLNPGALITESQPDVTEILLELNIPTVIVSTDTQYPGVTSIDVDDWQVGAEAARAFAQAGYNSFACLGNSTPYSEQRTEGFCQELAKDAKVSIHQEKSFNTLRYSEDFTQSQPGDALHLWLESLPKPVGIFAVHDPLGRFLCGVCREMGIRVPEEVAVIGANNDELVCGLSYPMLSSVSIPWDTIGEAIGEAVHSLLSTDQKTKPLSKAATASILVPSGGVILRHSANHLAVEDQTLRRAMTYFSENIQEPITIEILCHELRIARRGLEQKFRQHLHCTPWEMLCKLRVTRAKQLLTKTNHPISIISELSGFNDPERMAVVFKRVEGISPSAFRKGINRPSQ